MNTYMHCSLYNVHTFNFKNLSSLVSPLFSYTPCQVHSYFIISPLPSPLKLQPLRPIPTPPPLRPTPTPPPLRQTPTLLQTSTPRQAESDLLNMRKKWEDKGEGKWENLKNKKTLKNFFRICFGFCIPKIRLP